MCLEYQPIRIVTILVVPGLIGSIQQKRLKSSHDLIHMNNLVVISEWSISLKIFYEFQTGLYASGNQYLELLLRFI